MVKNSLIISLILLILCFIQFNPTESKYYFENKLWVYWDKPIQQAPIFVQLCYQKIRIVSLKQNWQLTLLSQQNLHLYIEKYEQFKLIKSNQKLPFKQSVADLIRLTIIEQHGGVWIDISSILIKGLSWLQHLQQQSHLISNYNNQIQSYKQPEMIQFYISNFQNRIQSYSNSNNINHSHSLVNFQPGYQIWFVSAKKHSQAISEWRKYFSQFFQQSFEEKVLKFSDENIFFRNIDHTDYMTGNKAFYYYLQRKQLELDKKLTIWNVLTSKSNRINVNKQLNIWGLHGEDGPLVFALRLVTDLEYLMTKTIEQIEQEYFQIKYYVKITQVVRNLIQQTLKYQFQFIKKYNISSNNDNNNNINNNNNIDNDNNNNKFNFSKYIQLNPSVQQCVNIKFIVSGSVMDFLLQSNKVADKYNLFTISTQQRNLWQSYCNQIIPIFSIYSINNIVNKIIGYASNIFQGSVSKRQYRDYKIYEKMDILEKVFIIIKVNRMPIMVGVIALLIIVGLLAVAKGGLKLYGRCLLNNNYNNRINKYNNNNSNNNNNDYGNIIDKVSKINNINNSNKWLYTYLLLVILCFILFFCIDQFGGFDQQFSILMLYLCYLFIDNKITKSIKQQSIKLHTDKKIRLEQIYILLLPFIYYYIGKCCLLSITRRPQKVVPFSVVICLITPFLLKMGENMINSDMGNNREGNLLLRLLISYSKYNKYLIIMYLSIISYYPNLRYIVNSTQKYYLIYNIIYMCLIYSSLLFLSICIQISSTLYNIFLSDNLLHNQNNLIYQSKQILTFINMTLVLLILYPVYYHIDENQWILPPAQRILFQFTILFIFINIIINLNLISKNNYSINNSINNYGINNTINNSINNFNKHMHIFNHPNIQQLLIYQWLIYGVIYWIVIIFSFTYKNDNYVKYTIIQWIFLILLSSVNICYNRYLQYQIHTSNIKSTSIKLKQYDQQEEINTKS